MHFTAGDLADRGDEQRRATKRPRTAGVRLWMGCGWDVDVDVDVDAMCEVLCSECELELK